MEPFTENEIVDLLSSDSEDMREILPVSASAPWGISHTFPAPTDNARAQDGRVPNHRGVPYPSRNVSGQMLMIDGEAVFIPDEEPERYHRRDQSPLPTGDAAAIGVSGGDQYGPNVSTADGCLQRVLEMYPGISHEYVMKLYHGAGMSKAFPPSPAERFHFIIQELVLSSEFPKQERQSSSRKRKRDATPDEDLELQKWMSTERATLPQSAKITILAMLKAEFPNVSKTQIGKVLKEEKHLFHSHIRLTASQYDETGVQVTCKGRPPQNHLADAIIIATNTGHTALLDELRAAQRHQETVEAKRTAAYERKMSEQQNLASAIAMGETAECSACFDDVPMNRQIHCDGKTAHFLCFECALTYIKSQVGESRCDILCPAGCGGGYADCQLRNLSDDPLVDKLSRLRQQKAIREAGLDDLEECPFCDFKAILPPVEEDFEFRCLDPDCEKVSCRRCKALTHIPLSCEEHARDRKIDSRHQVEEAMTKALIRICNKCKNQFIKEDGCNKMTCPNCGNRQCYVCSASVVDYEHFGNQKPKCPLHDNVHQRHEGEIRAAEIAARAQVVKDDPKIRADDLEIQFSEAVKQSTAASIAKAAQRDYGRGYPLARGMLDGAADQPFDFARAEYNVQVEFARIQQQRMQHLLPQRHMDEPARPRRAEEHTQLADNMRNAPDNLYQNAFQNPGQYHPPIVQRHAESPPARRAPHPAPVGEQLGNAYFASRAPAPVPQMVPMGQVDPRLPAPTDHDFNLAGQGIGTINGGQVRSHNKREPTGLDNANEPRDHRFGAVRTTDFRIHAPQGTVPEANAIYGSAQAFHPRQVTNSLRAQAYVDPTQRVPGGPQSTNTDFQFFQQRLMELEFENRRRLADRRRGLTPGQ